MIENLIASFNIMWKGMLGLFVCCGFIALVTLFLNRVFMPKDKK